MERVDVDYTCVLSEVSEILNYLDYNLLKQIPQNLIDKINEHKNKEYKFKYDKTKKFEEQDFMPETKSLISLIYLNYCCSEERKQELLVVCKENEEREEKDLQEKYNIDNLFKKKQEKNNNEEKNEKETSPNNQMIDLNKEKWYNKIINKVKRIFWRIK